MKLTLSLSCLASILSLASTASAADAKYTDPETGFTFSQYQASYSLGGKYITYRIAVPSDAVQGTAYDTVLQVVAPNDIGWLGLAWGGSMTYNPLTVAWSNNGNPVISSRYATSHSLPQPYSSATYQILKPGTRSNSTHWQFTAKCTGCTAYKLSNGNTKYLTPKGSNRLAFAYGATKPSQPSNPASSFSVHDVFGYWNQDFSQGQNPSLGGVVERNSSAAGGKRGERTQGRRRIEA